MRSALLWGLFLLGGVAAQQASRPGARVIAMDHLESKGATAWLVGAPDGDASLVIGRLGSPEMVRLSGRAMRDVMIDQTAKAAFVLSGRGPAYSVERVPLDSDAAPRTIVTGLVLPEPAFARAGGDVVLLTKDAVLAIAESGEVRTLLNRDDPRISRVAMNGRGSLLATERAGRIELVASDGRLLGSAGPGRSPVFLDESTLAFAREATAAGRDAVHASELLVADTSTPEWRRRGILALSGEISHLRPAGEGAVLLRHAPPGRDHRWWLLYVATGVVGAVEPRDWGALRRTASAPAAGAAGVQVPTPVPGLRTVAIPEPDGQTSGFFFIDETGAEVRTGYEQDGWDDGRNPDEARLYAKLLDRFLAGVQWPFRREGAYEPFFASDDEPMRPSSAVPHRGLDVGSRLMHISNGSVAFHAAGTPVYPLFRGGHVMFGFAMPLREGESASAPFRYRVLQQVELREGPYVLRIFVAYEHVVPYEAADLQTSPARPSPIPVTGDEAVGELETFGDASPSGGWGSGDPVLIAAGIEKGNHAHVGIGGIYRSFNTSPEAAARKLRWYRERLIPSLRKSLGPR